MNVDWARDCSGNARRALQRKARYRPPGRYAPKKKPNFSAGLPALRLNLIFEKAMDGGFAPIYAALSGQRRAPV